jgi:hypothetical protein
MGEPEAMSSRIELPPRLRGIFFDRLWDASKVWELDTAAERVSFGELEWHLDLEVWTTVPGEPRWDLSPHAVLGRPELYSRQWNRILNADLAFPLELFRQCDRWVILDGYHRLARHRIRGSDYVLVRRHPEECWLKVSRDGGAPTHSA